jgi:Putative Actinobacterial Holin-X, holin superfamily III
MLAPSGSLLRAGLSLKLNQIKLAMRSYLRDRTNQATGTVASYGIAAGLFAVAAIFLVAACFVGADALFRWVEINYGLFYAFGALGGLLLLLAAICAGLAAGRLKRPPPHFPTLTSRLRVAIKANPLHPDQLETARDTAAAILLTPSTPVMSADRRPPRSSRRPARGGRKIGVGLILMATLLGWAATRQRQPRRTEA